jgi:hypothetical protein
VRHCQLEAALLTWDWKKNRRSFSSLDIESTPLVKGPPERRKLERGLRLRRPVSHCGEAILPSFTAAHGGRPCSETAKRAYPRRKLENYRLRYDIEPLFESSMVGDPWASPSYRIVRGPSRQKPRGQRRQKRAIERVKVEVAASDIADIVTNVR